MGDFTERANFIWSIADILRGPFKRQEYQNVILPFTVLRRIDSVLAQRKADVLETYHTLKGRIENLDGQLCRASGYAFYNTSPFTFERLAEDNAGINANIKAYIAGFSENMADVLNRFDFPHTIGRLEDAGLLFLIVRKFKETDLHPDRVPNAEMGMIFEHLLRKFNEALNENPGEHYTPREVVGLMVDLLLAPVQAHGESGPVVHTICDPCCGTGGMLTAAKDRIIGTPAEPGINPQAQVFLFGQEVNPQTYAVCKSDLFLKDPAGQDAANIAFGSTLSRDAHAERNFELQLANPPYGHDWHGDETDVRAEAARGADGRFAAGLPRISDGQLLFLQHMLSHMRRPAEGGGRVAVVMNGSPLFTGDAGSGESEIRRWILESDWLEALIALPEQLFYNTGIPTYIAVLSNTKAEHRRGQVQLIDASGLWQLMRKSQGAKRREITPAQIAEIVRLYRDFQTEERCRIFPASEFGYRKITVERPLRLNFAATPERRARLEAQKAFADLAVSKKKDRAERERDERRGRALQEAIRAALAALPADRVWMDRAEFEPVLAAALAGASLPPPADALPGTEPEPLKLAAPVRKAILAALGERDPEAAICRDAKGHPEPDPELRDTENVPMAEDVWDYFAREVAPYVPDAWLNEDVRDEKDHCVGKVGYEINFNRYFYTYQPPRPLAEIDADIACLEGEILAMLRRVTEATAPAGGAA